MWLLKKHTSVWSQRVPRHDCKVCTYYTNHTIIFSGWLYHLLLLFNVRTANQPTIKCKDRRPMTLSLRYQYYLSLQFHIIVITSYILFYIQFIHLCLFYVISHRRETIFVLIYPTLCSSQHQTVRLIVIL